MKTKLRGYDTFQVLFAALAGLILLGAALIYVPSLIGSAKEERVLSETATLGSLISQYKMEIGEYPDSLSDLTKTKGQYGPWLTEVPMDKMNKGKSYQYLHSDTQFIVFGIGENGTAESNLSKGITGDDIGFAGR